MILDWLKSIRTAPDSRAVHLLVQRIEVTSDNEKKDFNVVSTLESVSEKLVAATDLIVHIREHLPILLGTRVTALRESKNRKAAK